MRIGVLGLGFMGTTHLKAWRNVPGAVLAAVGSDEPEKLSGDLSTVQGNLGEASDQVFDFSAVNKYTEAESLLADPAVEAVDICLPTHLHSSVAIAALRAGKHVLVEKPMALTADAAAEMLRERDRSGKILMVGQVLRFLPAYRALREAIATGAYGQVRTALFRRRCSAPFWSLWLGNADKSGGGVFDLLIHDIDFAVHMFGLPSTVSATGHEDLAVGIDTIAATMQYAGGPSVVVTGGWHHKKAYPFSMEYTVVADGGTFEFNSASATPPTIYTADGEAKPLPLPDGDPFEAELRYFHECCTKGEQPAMCPPEESAQSVVLARRILEARTAGGTPIAATA